MPRTIESILDAHQAAQQRRDAGQPIWDYTLDVAALWNSDTHTGPDRYRRIAERIKTSPWYLERDTSGGDEFGETVDGLAQAQTAQEFNDYWDDVYDRADRDRVWVKIR